MGEWRHRDSTTFRRGYIAATHEIRLPGLAGWSSSRLGHLTFHLHPETQWAVAQRGQAGVAVIGQSIDIDHGETDPGRVAKSLVRRLATSSLEAALRDASYLGGRATYVLHSAGATVIVPDLAGSHPIYWHHDGVRTVVSNYAHLIAEVTSADLNQTYIELMLRARELGAKRTIYWPGIETPFVGVKPVIPNHVLRISDGTAPLHERFYPFPDSELDGDPERGYQRFKEVFSEHVRLICSLDAHIGISLTGGADSQTTLRAAARYLKPDTAHTWTYLNSARPHEGMSADARAAAEVAGNMTLQHSVVDLDQSDRSLPRVAAFHEAVQRSMRYTSQMRSVPYAYAAQLPEATLELMSMVAEYGTGFYKNRRGVPDVGRLSEMYQLSEFGKHELVLAAFDKFIDYSEFDAVRAGPVDWHDLFYAEHRLARWASVRVQEVELVHRVHLPFNARASVEALVGLPLADRVEKQAQRRLIAELSQSGHRPGANSPSPRSRWRELVARGGRV